MTNISPLFLQSTSRQRWTVMAQAVLPPSILYRESEVELSSYRGRTVALLRRYARASVEVGRLPSLLGREFFRTRVTSYPMSSFEDVVIFVTDMEKAISNLSVREKQLIAMNILEEYTVDEVARLLACNPRTIRRLLRVALDQLSQVLLAAGLLDKLPEKWERCQEGKTCAVSVSNSKRKEYKSNKYVQTLPLM